MTDAWAKASECEREAATASDPDRWAVLMHLRDLWITFANEATLMSAEERSEEAAHIEGLHAEMTAPVVHYVTR